MSINIPPELDWLVLITAGQHWPKGDEDKMFKLGGAWRALGQGIAELGSELTAVESTVYAGLSGKPAEAFDHYIQNFKTVFPNLADRADQLAKYAEDVALPVE